MSKLSAQHLAKVYSGRKVVSDVSLEVSIGEIVGLLGPNGAGKTTSFYMIVGLVNADGGEIWLDNQEITYLAMHQRAKLGIGYLPQEASVFRKLSVEDNIMAILELNTELSKKQRYRKMMELLDEFQITHIQKSPGMALSGGERRRVEIARALANDPNFILLDEPFAGVDPISVTDIKNVIQQLRDRGLGVLITDHNVRETLDVCERAYIVESGKLLAQGSPGEILSNQQVKKVYLGENFKL
ncbi:LPS export ABC transporter ATP-binding protein [Aliikangiella coralliicola]|uniref:Lipopolysaccharide export system ATP-binding protein LptB n=1 Tax=Aliikangiella coralliicola TaxID=2592383 RepID=A0A545UJZ3_9GAMM|nr:LPS export ABC transporter ATP-binding protein [Aliikangiella coralliicola]TQV89787.1 LPS export ABC transporter ATP-binding protein [Aliikangiella coralliicola]